MDSKRTYKKLNTFFWTILTWLPIIIFFLNVILNINIYKLSTNSIYNNSEFILEIFNENVFFWEDYIAPISLDPLNQAFFDLMKILDISQTNIGILFSWMVSVQIYHVIVDILMWLPHKMHEFIE